jgi:hypothetical protein
VEAAEHEEEGEVRDDDEGDGVGVVDGAVDGHAAVEAEEGQPQRGEPARAAIAIHRRSRRGGRQVLGSCGGGGWGTIAVTLLNYCWFGGGPAQQRPTSAHHDVPSAWPARLRRRGSVVSGVLVSKVRPAGGRSRAAPSPSPPQRLLSLSLSSSKIISRLLAATASKE